MYIMKNKNNKRNLAHVSRFNAVDILTVIHLDNRDTWRWSISGNEFTVILYAIDAANSWYVRLAKTQTCLSCWYVASIGRNLFFVKMNSPEVKALPPTSANLFLHILRANLWKVADQQDPHDVSADISQFC